jgi:hypothetical protein
MDLRRSFQPGLGFVFKGLVTKGDAGRFTAATSDAIIGFYVNRALLIFYGFYRTDSHGIAILTIMFADNVKHRDFLSTRRLY